MPGEPGGSTVGCGVGRAPRMTTHKRARRIAHKKLQAVFSQVKAAGGSAARAGWVMARASRRRGPGGGGAETAACGATWDARRWRRQAGVRSVGGRISSAGWRLAAAGRLGGDAGAVAAQPELSFAGLLLEGLAVSGLRKLYSFKPLPAIPGTRCGPPAEAGTRSLSGDAFDCSAVRCSAQYHA